MARYQRGYVGERRSEKLTLQLTPTERATLEAAAQEAGATVSQHVREQYFRRAAALGPTVAGTQRDPERRALLGELTAIGNNLNQLARISNTMGSVPQLAELQTAMEALKATMAKVVGAC